MIGSIIGLIIGKLAVEGLRRMPIQWKASSKPKASS
jgi:hypothetical protein